MVSGYDGLIYSIGFLVGWPILTFLMAERLRNLGKFTFPTWRRSASPRPGAHLRGLGDAGRRRLLPDRADGRRRALIKLLFGLDYWIAVVIVGALMMIYVLFGGMTATTWVQIIKACLLLAGASFMGFMVLELRFQPRADVRGSGAG